jgi:hypothetical protein
LCGLTLAQNHSIGSRNEMPQSLVEVQNAAANAAGTFPGDSWKRVSSLERAGRSKDKLAAARQYADSIHSSAVMIIQGGEVVDQWGDIDTKLSSYSVRKSLISALLWNLFGRRRYRR